MARDSRSGSADPNRLCRARFFDRTTHNLEDSRIKAQREMARVDLDVLAVRVVVVDASVDKRSPKPALAC